jgi:CCR4-NOT transcription complex subunit 9
VDDPEVVNFLLQTEIFPVCLRVMGAGSELSKTVATFIVQKILLDEAGLQYVCATSERFYMLTTVLASMIGNKQQAEPLSVRLLKHVVRCYLRLSDHASARDALCTCLPESLRDQTFAATIRNEDSVQKWLAALLKNIGDGPGSGGVAGGLAGASGNSGSSTGLAAMAQTQPPSWQFASNGVNK